LFTDKINHLAPLPNSLNLKNSQDLLKNLEGTPMHPHYTLASLDIASLYTYIPVKETRAILANILQQRLIHPKTQQELLKWYDIITKQNYFAHKEQIVVQHDRLAMGAPS
jgi:hypothetical protein